MNVRTSALNSSPLTRLQVQRALLMGGRDELGDRHPDLDPGGDVDETVHDILMS